MGALFSTPKTPGVLPASQNADVGDSEAKRKAKADRKRTSSQSSFAASKVAGAVNPAYYSGTKTAQGQ